MSEIAIYTGAFALGGTLLGIGTFLGSIRAQYITKAECKDCRNDCSKQQSDKIDKIEKVLSERIDSVDNRYNDKTELLFEKIDQLTILITRSFEEIRLDLVKMQTSILAHEKRLEGK